MKRLVCFVLTAVFLFITASVQASVTSLVDGSYEVTYQPDIKGGTIYGSDITDIFIFEKNSTQFNVDYIYTAAAKGLSTITHTIPFDPTHALLLGLDRASAGSGLEEHLIVFMDNDFAADAITKEKFSDVFPAVGARPRIRHNEVVQALKDAQLGDTDALQLLSDFFLEDAGKYAAFDPNYSFRVLEFSPPVAIDVVPEPATMLLLGGGLTGAFLRRRKS